jgi:hypothetical protein
MHPTQTTDQFIELRSKGLSLAAIAAQLNVSKRTLVDWNRRFHADVAALRAVELEAIQDRILASHEIELERLACVQSKIEASLAVREFHSMGTETLIRLSQTIRRQIKEVRADLKPLTELPEQHQETSPAPEPAAPVHPTPSPVIGEKPADPVEITPELNNARAQLLKAAREACTGNRGAGSYQADPPRIILQNSKPAKMVGMQSPASP